MSPRQPGKERVFPEVFGLGTISVHEYVEAARALR